MAELRAEKHERFEEADRDQAGVDRVLAGRDRGATAFDRAELPDVTQDNPNVPSRALQDLSRGLRRSTQNAKSCKRGSGGRSRAPSGRQAGGPAGAAGVSV